MHWGMLGYRYALACCPPKNFAVSLTNNFSMFLTVVACQTKIFADFNSLFNLRRGIVT